jgi:hypothetical protein
MNDEWERHRKEAVLYFKVLSQHLTRSSDENDRKPSQDS